MNILLSMRVTKHHAYHEVQDAISHDWLNFFSKRQLYPILVPNMPLPEEFLNELPARGLILTGGNSLGEYKTKPLQFKDNRDCCELRLVQYALSRNMPILGVCRGFQLLNIFYNGHLTRNIPRYHDAQPHELCLRSAQFTMKDDQNIFVNSYHTQGVTTQDLSPELDLVATDGQGWVEAFKHKTQQIWGMQWHPERVNPQAKEIDDMIINQWVEACA